jgi:hypothetical protein
MAPYKGPDTPDIELLQKIHIAVTASGLPI